MQVFLQSNLWFLTMCCFTHRYRYHESDPDVPLPHTHTHTHTQKLGYHLTGKENWFPCRLVILPQPRDDVIQYLLLQSVPRGVQTVSAWLHFPHESVNKTEAGEQFGSVDSCRTDSQLTAAIMESLNGSVCSQVMQCPHKHSHLHYSVD